MMSKMNRSDDDSSYNESVDLLNTDEPTNVSFKNELSSQSSSSSSSSSSGDDVDEASRAELSSSSAVQNKDDRDSKSAASHPQGRINAGPIPMSSGSRSRLPGKGLKRKWSQSRTSHSRQLEKRGRIAIKEHRTKQQRIASLLDEQSDEKDEALGSSSEENSVDEEEKLSDRKRDYVDWNELADSSWAGRDCVFQAMPVKEISSLVGWATHCTHCGESNSNPTNDPSEQAESMPVAETTNINDSNPLLCLSDSPLPPSHLKFISQRAEEQVWSSIRIPRLQDQSNCTWVKHRFLANSDVSDDESPPKTSKPKRLPWQEGKWTYGSDDETYRLFDNFRRTKEVELSVPESRGEAPCPTESNVEGVAANHDHSLFRSFDQSALVALGMVVEESLTASLLPLARSHVTRCLKLEAKNRIHHEGSEGNEDIISSEQLRRSHDEDPFHEWTLPPAEALHKVLRDSTMPPPGEFTVTEGVVGLPSAYPASVINHDMIRSAASHREVNVSESVLESLLSVPSYTMEQQVDVSMRRWCVLHGLEPSFVANNMDLYRLFLPSPNSSAPSPWYEREERTTTQQLKHQRRLGYKLSGKKEKCNDTGI